MRAALPALIAAALFGASTPLAKGLLGEVHPLTLAGLLYLGAGAGCALLYAVRRRVSAQPPEATLSIADLPTLAAVIVSGGLVAPVLLVFGLAATSASTAALLLNLEALATMAIAWVVLREATSRRVLSGAVAILAAAVLLSWQGSATASWGAAAIAGACVAWGIDNNLTRRLSFADPLQITAFKGLAAGTVNCGLALGLTAGLPPLPAVLWALVVGFLGYGVSLALFVISLRQLGVARTSAYFAAAPFLGAGVAVLLLDEPASARLLAAGALMAVGVYLHLSERHAHEHRHESLAHEHRHTHDAHHDHHHGTNDPAGQPHTHTHTHAPMWHSHPHFPDLHHRHEHGQRS